MIWEAFALGIFQPTTSETSIYIFAVFWWSIVPFIPLFFLWSVPLVERLFFVLRVFFFTFHSSSWHRTRRLSRRLSICTWFHYLSLQYARTYHTYIHSHQVSNSANVFGAGRSNCLFPPLFSASFFFRWQLLFQQGEESIFFSPIPSSIMSDGDSFPLCFFLDSLYIFSGTSHSYTLYHQVSFVGCCVDWYDALSVVAVLSYIPYHTIPYQFRSNWT